MDFLASLLSKQTLAPGPQQTQTGGATVPGFGVPSADNIDPKSDSPLYQEFNRRLTDLLTGLCEAVPENKTLQLAFDVHRLLCKTLPGEPLRRWLSSIKHHGNLLVKRTPENEAAFIAVMPTLDYIKELEIVEYWDEFDDDAKDNLWQHLAQLHSLAQTCGLFSAELMDRMNSIAEVMANEDERPSIGRICEVVMADSNLLQMVGLDPSQVNDPMVKAVAQQMVSQINLE